MRYTEEGVRGRGGWCGMRYTEEGMRERGGWCGMRYTDEGKGWVVWDEVHG